MQAFVSFKKIKMLKTLLFSFVVCSFGSLYDFEKIIQKILSSSHEKCHSSYKQGHVYVSYTNSYHFPLLLKQREAMEITGVRACLEPQFVTLCYDLECLNLCSLHDIPNCIIISNYHKIRNSDFSQNDYWYTSLNHHLAIRDTLKVPGVKTACIVDADIVFFRSITDRFDLEAYDFQHQTESGNGCDGEANGGLTCFRSSSQAIQFAEMLISMNQTWLNGAMDQSFMPEIAKQTNATRCAFDKKYILGNCGSSHDGSSLYKDIMTLHTTCMTNFETKKRMMQHVIDTMKLVLHENIDMTVSEGGV